MEGHGNEYWMEREGGLMTHEITPQNRLENQIAIATDLYMVLHGDERKSGMTDTEFRNEIMTFWSEAGYTDAYREIEKDPGFNIHPRLSGDIFKITPRDVIYYKENRELPED